MTWVKVKPVVDRLVAAAVLVASAPILAVVGCVIAVRMGRPVLFRQVRIGLDGKPFELVKFRSMRDGNGSDADRLTEAGRWLRSTSVDELPELYNIARGEMSFVGPRPLLPEYVPLYNERQATRHNVRPGLTGLAQVNGRNAQTWEDRLEMDASYAADVTLRGDLSILRTTIAVVLSGRGVSADAAATMERFTGTPEPAEVAS